MINRSVDLTQGVIFISGETLKRAACRPHLLRVNYGRHRRSAAPKLTVFVPKINDEQQGLPGKKRPSQNTEIGHQSFRC